MTYRFLEDIATADAAFEAEGKTPEELFTSTAEALEESQVNTKDLSVNTKRPISLENSTLENLLFDFLNELIFYKDSEGLAFTNFMLEIRETNKGYKLEGTLKGEKIDPAKHELRTDVKAVTKHQFEVKKTPKGYRAKVVLDI